MTLGSPDSVGIGRYDETTPIGLEFSDYMNEGLASVSAAVGALKVAGLVPVIPTSVAGTGVTYSTTTGLVTFAATTTAAPASVNGVFTSAYRNYLVQATVTSRSTTSFCTFKMRSSGTDLSTGYDLVRTIRAATVTTAQLANNGDIPLGSGNFASNEYAVTLYGPHLAAQMRVMSRNIESSAAAAATIVEVDGSTRSTTSRDGFTLIPAAGTMTGTLKVYGYN